MSDRLHAALLGMTDPARKLADALEEYSTNLGMGRTDLNAADIQELFDIKNALSNSQRDIPEPHASIVTATTDRDILETLQGQADELLHAIDLARLNVQGAIPLQTLDLVRGKVKDVVENLTGTIEKDL